MRLRILFQLDREVLLPMNHQYQLSGMLYEMLKTSSPEFARFLHDEGYHLEDDSFRRFKLFTFSGLRIPADRRRAEGDQLRVRPGCIEWLVSSPREDFLVHSATGLLSAGHELKLGAVPLRITEVSALPEPPFVSPMRFTCLTPIVVSKRLPDGRTHYIRPLEGAAFSEAVRCNLLRKYGLLNEGAAPADESFRLEFDARYLADERHRGGTKKITVKQGIDVIGALCPFVASGSAALIGVGYRTGFGEKNSLGFGMAEVATGNLGKG